MGGIRVTQSEDVGSLNDGRPTVRREGRSVSPRTRQTPHIETRFPNMSGAKLSGANLTDAEITQDQLDACESLEGATMPDGSQHP